MPPIQPPVTPPVSKPPLFEKTFGDMKVAATGFSVGQYKSIRFLIDPAFDASSVSTDELKMVDYVFLTGFSPRHLSTTVQSVLKKDIKILTTAAGASALRKDGFTQVKDAEGGRVLLQKDSDYLFVSAFQGGDAAGAMSKGYLLEFDNGKNLFVAGDVIDEAPRRNFLYEMRDDGKEISEGFFYPSGDEAAIAKSIALFQPKIAVLLPGAIRPVDEPKLRDALKEELFEGEIYIARPSESIPF